MIQPSRWTEAEEPSRQGTLQNGSVKGVERCCFSANGPPDILDRNDGLTQRVKCARSSFSPFRLLW